MTIITTHINADFDAIGGLIAAKKLYPEGVIVLPPSMEKRVRDFLETFNPIPEAKKIKDIMREDIKRIVIVDCSSSERLGDLRELIKKARLIIYDHHRKGDLLTGGRDIEIHIEDVGATATLFTELLQKARVSISPLEATILSLGIYEETGSFTFPSTTERDLLAATYLLKRGANLNIVSSFLKPFINREDLSLLTDLIDESRDLIIENVRIKICKAKREEYPGEIAHLAHRIMEMEEIDGLIMLVDIGGKVSIIARSTVPELDVEELLSRFGGGGHPTASSATIKDRSLEELESELIILLKEIVKPERLARDIMTSPVITIGPEATIKEAERELTKYGVNVLPITKDGRFLGFISRETVQKAIFYGFKLHRVMEFATTDAEVVSPETPVKEVERLMMEQNQRFMPVIKDGILVGVITRTDILKTMYERLLKREVFLKEMSPRLKNLSSRLSEHFPEEILTLLKKAGEVAELLGYNAYLVGGSVRDILRGERNPDIDIVIEGDGIIFAKKLVEVIDAQGLSLRVHERFRTAKIIIDGLNLDIATARTEYYESPASLPKVETSSIKKDLFRRDFTINTLAIKLNPREFGNLIDFFGAQKDLKEGTIRVLHTMSFVEDPTRALRAIRFSERFGFKISKDTENLIRQAVKMNLFERLSSKRLYKELSLLLKEVSPTKAVERLSQYGLLGIIHPSLKFDEAMKKRLRDLEETLQWFSLSGITEEIHRDKLSIEAIVYELSGDALLGALKKISPHSRYLSEVQRDINSAKEALRRLQSWDLKRSEEPDPVELYNLLHDLSMESILLLISTSEDHKIKRLSIKYLEELRNIRPAITGKDLIRLGLKPGPEFSKIFREILNEKLRGRLKTKQEEIQFVMERAL